MLEPRNLSWNTPHFDESISSHSFFNKSLYSESLNIAHGERKGYEKGARV